MSNPRPVLSDMPWHIKDKIVESSDILSRCSLRKCSRDLRCVVDRSNWRFEFIELKFTDSSTSLTLTTGTDDVDKEETFVYTSNATDSCLIRGKSIGGMCHVARAVSDLAVLLKSPKTVVDLLHITDDREQDNGVFLNAMRHSFAPFSHQLNIEHFHCFLKLSPEAQSTVLSYLKPGFLEHFSLSSLDENQETSGGLDELEQWRLARTMNMQHQCNFSMRQLLQFGSVCIGECRMTTEDLEEVIEFSVSWHLSCATMLHYETIVENLKERALRQYKDNFLLKIPGAQCYVQITLYEHVYSADKCRSRNSMYGDGNVNMNGLNN